MVFWELIIIACVTLAVIYIVRIIKVSRNPVSTNKSRSGIEYKVFIAGSTSLHLERDSIRAVVSEIHNKWSFKGITLTSYTFEDFDNRVHEGGLQRLYNNFIANEADCVVFIIDGQIGAQTLEEFNISFNSFRYRQKPSILVYSKNERNSHPQTEAFISNMNKVKHYWRVYTDIISLKLKFKEDITNELINLL